MKDETILPCPFCGNTPVLDQKDNLVMLVCPTNSLCSGSGLLCGFLNENRTRAISAWNFRAVTESMVAAGAVLSTSGRENDRNYRKRVYQIIDAALHANKREAKNMASHKDALQYIVNTNGGATRAIFEEDFEPVGGFLLHELIKAGHIMLDNNGRLFLTEAGKAALAAA